MEHLGKVIEIQGEFARIQLTKSTHCAGCTSCDMFDTRGPRELQARNEIQAKPGDFVKIEIAPSQVIGSSLFIFIFPIVAMMLGYWLGSNFAAFFNISGEIAGISGSIGFLGIAFLIIFMYDRFYGHKHQPQARLIALTSENLCMNEHSKSDF